MADSSGAIRRMTPFGIGDGLDEGLFLIGGGSVLGEDAVEVLFVERASSEVRRMVRPVSPVLTALRREMALPGRGGARTHLGVGTVGVELGLGDVGGFLRGGGCGGLMRGALGGAALGTVGHIVKNSFEK